MPANLPKVKIPTLAVRSSYVIGQRKYFSAVTHRRRAVLWHHPLARERATSSDRDSDALVAAADAATGRQMA